jgi:hypothetical protein
VGRASADGRGARRLERGAAAAIALLPLALVLLRCGLDPEVPFVTQRGGAAWIMAPTPVSAQLQQWGEVLAPVESFERRFTVPEPVPARVTLRIQSLGRARVQLNGAELPEAHPDAEKPPEAPGDTARGRRTRALDVAPWLRPGENELRVEVANAHGPALLRVESEGLPQPVASGPTWQVRERGRLHANALVADDTRPNPLAFAVETPGEAVAARADALLLLFLLGALGLPLWRRWPGGRAALSPLARAAPLLASAGWLYVYFAKAARIPGAVGFDARHHVQYVDLLAAGHLPLASDGWSTYHPPLFYAAAALLRGVGGGDALLKLLPLASGLGCVWLAWGLARRLFPGRTRLAALATLFAAVLPVNLYSASYFSNEPTHALLAGAALYAFTCWLLAAGAAFLPLVLAAACFGLAALTKFTALVAVPVALFFAAWKLLLVERAGLRRALVGVLAFAGVFLALAGWFYARNLWHFGAPVVGNWALPGEGRTWWQQPGFHTVAWYTGFGEALVHPYLAGFHSFWDALYATFWGDGYIAGRADPQQRHDFWDYGFMSAGYWVALPATALLLLGGALLLRRALAAPGEEGSSADAAPARERLALGFLATSAWAVFLAFFQLTLLLPFFAQAKAAYLLLLTPVFALAFARGFGALDDALSSPRLEPARALLYGWLSLFAGTLFLGFAA